ncbi:hypothetical protein BED47_00700 [Gottfriedia luciferensis]|uniref:Uncharacterized protein n=1 Tax=Gottfriedia luciferensis TaxID=178774 RepID=A0ABX2ZVL9_9BACI|nr:hypothetical protein [Gottfriedia luciferensis]ODG93722.1 hypothetical protein BED47_00700 [Gottfriedia luciferensis]
MTNLNNHTNQMEMRQMIHNYQQNGDRTVINYILELCKTDYTTHPSRKVNKTTNEQHHINYKMEDTEEIYYDSKGRVINKVEYIPVGEGYTIYTQTGYSVSYDFPEGSMEYIAIAINGLNHQAKRAVFKRVINKHIEDGFDDFRYFEDELPEIKDYINTSWEELTDLVTPLILSYETDHIVYQMCDYFKVAWRYNKFMEALKEIEDGSNIEKITIEALKHALSKVDVTFEPKQIIKFINLSFKNKWIDLQLKGSRGKYVNGEYRLPQFKENQKTIHMLFKKGTKINLKKLNDKQRELINQLVAIIEDDMKNNPKVFKVNKKGIYTVSKRYLAERTNQSESGLKHKLIRIENKMSS